MSKSNSKELIKLLINQKKKTKFLIVLISFSAAHCFQVKGDVKIRAAPTVLALLGKYNLRIPNEPKSVESSVWEIILHPDWKSSSSLYDADIVVVVLEKPVDFTPKIKPISLPEPTESEFTENGFATGWGISEHSNGRFYPISGQLKLPAVTQSKCFEEVPLLKSSASNRTFCAGFLYKKKSTCTGDSGGGFYFKNSTRHLFELRGIVSAGITYGNGKCDSDSYSLFMNVARFSNWINKQQLD